MSIGPQRRFLDENELLERIGQPTAAERLRLGNRQQAALLDPRDPRTLACIVQQGAGNNAMEALLQPQGRLNAAPASVGAPQDASRAAAPGPDAQTRARGTNTAATAQGRATTDAERTTNASPHTNGGAAHAPHTNVPSIAKEGRATSPGAHGPALASKEAAGLARGADGPAVAQQQNGPATSAPGASAPALASKEAAGPASGADGPAVAQQQNGPSTTAPGANAPALASKEAAGPASGVDGPAAAQQQNGPSTTSPGTAVPAVASKEAAGPATAPGADGPAAAPQQQQQVVGPAAAPGADGPAVVSQVPAAPQTQDLATPKALGPTTAPGADGPAAAQQQNGPRTSTPGAGGPALGSKEAAGPATAPGADGPAVAPQQQAEGTTTAPRADGPVVATGGEQALAPGQNTTNASTKEPAGTGAPAVQGARQDGAFSPAMRGNRQGGIHGVGGVENRVNQALSGPRDTVRQSGRELRSMGDRANGHIASANNQANERLGGLLGGLGGFGKRLRAWGDDRNRSIRSAETTVNQRAQQALAPVAQAGANLRQMGDRANAGIARAEDRTNAALKTGLAPVADLGARLRQWGDSQNARIGQAENRANDALGRAAQPVANAGRSLRQWGDARNADIARAEDRTNTALQPLAQKLRPVGQALRAAGDRVNYGEAPDTAAAAPGKTPATQTPAANATQQQGTPANPAATATATAVDGNTAQTATPPPPVVDQGRVQEVQSGVGDASTATAPQQAVTQNQTVPAQVVQSTQGAPTVTVKPHEATQAVEAQTGKPTAEVAPGAADTKAPMRSASQLGAALQDKTDAPHQPLNAPPVTTPAEPQRLAGVNVGVGSEPSLPTVESVRGRSRQGMRMPNVAVNLPPRAESHEDPVVNGERGAQAGSQDQQGAGAAPPKTQAQIQAEAQQVGQHAQTKLQTEEHKLQDQASTEAETRKTAATSQRDTAETAARTQGDTEVATEEARGAAERQQKETEAQQREAQARTEGQGRETQATAEGATRRTTAEAQHTTQVQAQQTQQAQQTAAAEAQQQADERQQQQQVEGQAAQRQAEGERRRTTATQQGETDSTAARGRGDQESEALRTQLTRESQTLDSDGARRAAEREQQGRSEQQRIEAQGRARQRDLERQAERERSDRGLLERAWDAVSSAFNRLMDMARSAWNQAVALARSAWNQAVAAARAIRDAARRAAQAVMARLPEGLTRIADRIRGVIAGIRDRVSQLIDAATTWVREQVASLWNRFRAWVAERMAQLRAAIAAIRQAISQAIDVLVTALREAVEAITTWVRETIEAARRWVQETLAAIGQWLEQAWQAVRDAVVSAVRAIVARVTAAVRAAYEACAQALRAAGQWLSEQWDRFCQWAQEAFVKFWTGPWRDVLIGIAVAVLIAAVTVATGGVGLAVIVAVSAGATAALRAGGEIAARRCAVAIRNGDPARAQRFEAEMQQTGGDAAEWYQGVRRDESWGTTLGRGAVEGARGAVEGAVSGLVGGAGGALATRVAGGIARAGATQGANLLARQGVQRAAEWGARTAIDAGMGLAGDVVTGAANAGIDVATGQRTWDEAWRRRVTPQLTPGSVAARVAGSGFGATLNMGGHRGPGQTVQDRLVARVSGVTDPATTGAIGRVARATTGMVVDGVQGGMTSGLQSVANGGNFAEGFGQGFVGGVGSSAGRSAVEGRAPRPTTAGHASGDSGAAPHAPVDAHAQPATRPDTDAGAAQVPHRAPTVVDADATTQMPARQPVDTQTTEVPTRPVAHGATTTEVPARVPAHGDTTEVSARAPGDTAVTTQVPVRPPVDADTTQIPARPPVDADTTQMPVRPHGEEQTTQLPARRPADGEVTTQVPVRRPDADTQVTTQVPVRAPADGETTVVTRQPGEPEAATTAPSRHEQIQQHQADRLTRLLPGNVPGLPADVRVVPDSHMGSRPPNVLTVSEARTLMRTISALRGTETGRTILAQIEAGGFRVTLEPGKGSSCDRDNRVINLDPALSDRQTLAGVLAHEGHHAATTSTVPNGHMADRDTYVRGSLRDEAEAQARALEHHREAGSTRGQNEFGHNEYHAAYAGEYLRLSAIRPPLSHDEIRRQAVEAGTQALQRTFGQAVPSTSLDDRGNLRPGAPRNYDELYGDWHDRSSLAGADAAAGVGHFAPPPPVQGTATAPRTLVDQTPIVADERAPGPRAASPEREGAPRVRDEHAPPPERAGQTVRPLGAGAFESQGPDGVSRLTRQSDGTFHREYPARPRTPEEAQARSHLVLEEARQRIQANDAQTRATVDAAFERAQTGGAEGVVVDRLILGAGGAAVQNYATHDPSVRAARGADGMPSVLSIAQGGDPWPARQGLIGQSAEALSNPANGLRHQPEHFMEANSAGRYARTDAVGAAIADTRAQTGMPVYQAAVRRVETVENGQPARYRVVVEQTVQGPDGRPVTQQRTFFANDVDVATGPGPDRTLHRDRVLTPEVEGRLRSSGHVVGGDGFLSSTPRAGERVLVTGGGATAAWDAAHAMRHGAEVQWIARPGSDERPHIERITRDLAAVEAAMRDPSANIAQLAADRATLRAELNHLSIHGARDSGMVNTDGSKGPFGASNLPRNRETVQATADHRRMTSIASIDGPLTSGPNAGKLHVRFADGTEGHFDRVVVAHGQDAEGAGGPIHTLGQVVSPAGGAQRARPILNAAGELLGVQVGDGVRVVGPAAAARAWGAHMTPEDRLAFLHALDERSHAAGSESQRRAQAAVDSGQRPAVSSDSWGVPIGLETWADSYGQLNQPATSGAPGS